MADAPANVSFDVVCTHDGIDTSNYELHVDGVKRSERSRTSIEADPSYVDTTTPFRIQLAGGLPRGSYELTVVAANAFDATPSDPRPTVVLQKPSKAVITVIEVVTGP